jgi:glycosyltransferase involved in cell wall biosynthesis
MSASPVAAELHDLVEVPVSAAPRLDAHVVLVTNFIPPYGVPLLRALAARLGKFTVLISTPMESNRRWSPEWGDLDVRVQRTFTFRRSWKHPAGFSDVLNVHVPWDTLGRLRQLRPDAVVSAELGFRSAASALFTRWSRRTSLVLWATLSEHTEQGRGAARYLLRKWLVRQADAVVVNGASGQRYMTRLGFDPARTIHLPYSGLAHHFSRAPLERDATATRRLLCVGQLIERKGLAPFLTALARWAQSNPQRRVELALAGSGPIRPQLDAIARPANLSLEFLGERSYGELPACYASADIFAFPTLADEWGLVVNEALASGLPVLGSRFSQAVEELVDEGRTGWTFRPDLPGEMDKAIERALSVDAEQLAAMRPAARARVAQITPDACAERMLAALRLAIARKRGSV